MRYLFFVLLFILSNAFSSSPNSFSIAKKIAAEMFQVNPNTIYCHCTYFQKNIDLSSCNMQSAKNIKRANRIEWEHIEAAEE